MILQDNKFLVKNFMYICIYFSLKIRMSAHKSKFGGQPQVAPDLKGQGGGNRL